MRLQPSINNSLLHIEWICLRTRALLFSPCHRDFFMGPQVWAERYKCNRDRGWWGCGVICSCNLNVTLDLLGTFHKYTITCVTLVPIGPYAFKSYSVQLIMGSPKPILDVSWLGIQSLLSLSIILGADFQVKFSMGKCMNLFCNLRSLLLPLTFWP